MKLSSDTVCDLCGARTPHVYFCVKARLSKELGGQEVSLWLLPILPDFRLSRPLEVCLVCQEKIYKEAAAQLRKVIVTDASEPVTYDRQEWRE